MENDFNAYEGFKMACLTCARTLNNSDGMEVTSKLLWGILSMYLAITYAMLFDKERWKIEDEQNASRTRTLVETIRASEEMKNFAPFVKQYLNEEEEKQKIDNIQYIRNNVSHANAFDLKMWTEDIAHLIDLLKLCLKIALEITMVNESSSEPNSKKMRQYCEHLRQQIQTQLEHYPSS